MSYISRLIEHQIPALLETGVSILLLGPLQTGKTTMLSKIPADWSKSFIQTRERLRYEREPSILADEIIAFAEGMDKTPLIILDEVQKVPDIMDVVQDLIDKKVAQFILTGSSARKLKAGNHINLLPGRVIPLDMHPVCFQELPDSSANLENLLVYGSLPAIVTTPNIEQKELLLEAYVMTYLEEEVRREALVRNLGSFARFLELAASESGFAANLSKLAQTVGVPRNTIADYFQILEDCLVAHRIEPYTVSKTRHKLSKAQKYLVFDMGVRRVAAREGAKQSQKQLGHLFEQYVGLELIWQAKLQKNRPQIKYWRDADGPEVDWLVETPEALIPIEVKYTDKPSLRDARHLQLFLDEYPGAKTGYVVCQTPNKMKLAENLYALPWQAIKDIFASAN